MLTRLHFIALIQLLLASPAYSACGLGLTANAVTVNWDLNFTSLSVSFTVTKANNPRCSYGVGFSKGNGSSYDNRRMTAGASELSYQLYGNSGLTQVLKDVPDITDANDVITGSFGTGRNRQQTKTYYVSIPLTDATEPVITPSGNYTDSFLIHVYEGSNPTAFTTPESTANVTITGVVPKILQISVTGVGGSFDSSDTSENLDFGDLEPSETKSFALQARTNAGYEVSVSSANNGQMKHISTLNYISYALAVDETTFNLSSSAATPVPVASGSGQTSMSGSSHTSTVTIGGYDQAFAGSYSDTITVTAATTE